MWKTPNTYTSAFDLHLLRKEYRDFIRDKKGWRTHGLGMCQKYVADGVRLHIWHPSLCVFSEKDSIHSHRGGLFSRVLWGSIYHVEVEVDSVAEEKSTHIVTAFHEGQSKKLLKITDHVEIKAEHPIVVEQGESYFFPKFAWHKGWADELCITLVELGKKSSTSYALFEKGSKPLHGHLDNSAAAFSILEEAVKITENW